MKPRRDVTGEGRVSKKSTEEECKTENDKRNRDV
jgi:hypothetical protein